MDMACHSSFQKGGSVTLTCILCKVLEHIIASNIVSHLEEQDVLYDLQHGFRQGRSHMCHACGGPCKEDK